MWLQNSCARLSSPPAWADFARGHALHLVSLGGDAQKRGDNARPRDQRAANCAGDFRFAPSAATVGDRHFDYSQPRPRGAHMQSRDSSRRFARA